MKKMFLIVVLLAGLLAGQLVNAQNGVTINASTTTVCAGSSPTLQAVPSGPNFLMGYLWSTGETGSMINPAPMVTTSYSVTATFDAGPPVTASVTITVQTPTVTISAAGPTTFCEGFSVILNSTTTGATSYQWKLNGANIAGATSPSYVATQNGDHSLAVSNGSCTINSLPITVTVNPLPIVTVSPNPNDTVTVCNGSSTTFSANLVAGYTYQWQTSPTIQPGIWTDIPGATTNTCTTNIGEWHRVRVTGSNGCVRNSNW